MPTLFEHAGGLDALHRLWEAGTAGLLLLFLSSSILRLMRKRNVSEFSKCWSE
jgi:hypothetical protein